MCILLRQTLGVRWVDQIKPHPKIQEKLFFFGNQNKEFMFGQHPSRNFHPSQKIFSENLFVSGFGLESGPGRTSHLPF